MSRGHTLRHRMSSSVWLANSSDSCGRVEASVTLILVAHPPKCRTSVLSPASLSTALMICSMGVMPGIHIRPQAALVRRCGNQGAPVPPAIMPMRRHLRSSSPPPWAHTMSCAFAHVRKLCMDAHLRWESLDSKQAAPLVRVLALRALKQQLETGTHIKVSLQRRCCEEQPWCGGRAESPSLRLSICCDMTPPSGNLSLTPRK